MSLRKVEDVFSLIVSMRDHSDSIASAHGVAEVFELGRCNAFTTVIDLLSRVDSCSIPDLHAAVENARNPKEK